MRTIGLILLGLLLTVSVSGQLAYSANLFAGTTTVIDCNTNTPVATIPIGNIPEAVAVNTVLRKVYITNKLSNSISVISNCSYSVETTVNGVGNGPVGIAVSPDGQRIYVSEYNSNLVRVYNANTHALITTIIVGSNPTVTAPLGMIVSPDNSRLYVTIFDEAKIAVINTATNTVLTYYTSDSRPVGLDISNDGSRLYSACQITNTLAVFNTATGTRVATIVLGPVSPLTGVGAAAGVTVNHANTKAYVTIQDASTVKVIDLATNTVTNTINVGGRPFGIDILPDDSRVYVGCVDADRMDVINTATNTVVTNVPTGDGPYSLGKFIMRKNIDSVRITKVPAAGCNNYSFNGQAFINGGTTVSSWNWTFSSGGSATGQNITHAFPAGTHTVKLLVTDNNGCKDSITTSVTFPVFRGEAGNDSTVCRASSFSLNAHGSGIVSYSWTPTAPLSNPNIANPAATINTTTKFYVTVTNATGCTHTDSVTYTVQQVTVNTTPDTAVCRSVPLQLNTNGLNVNSYSWTPATGLSNTNTANPVATPVNTIKYYVTGTSAIGCPAIDSVLVTVRALPVVATSPDTSVCTGTGAQLNTTGANNYSWSPATGLNATNIPNPTASPSSSTQYIVSGADANGCVGKDTVNIGVNPLPTITASNDTAICNMGTIQLMATGGTNYTWSPSTGLNNPNIANPTATVNSSQVYNVLVTDANRCSRQDAVVITVAPVPTYNISPPASSCENGQVQLLASGGDQYLWSPATGLSATNISNPVAVITATTTYSVRIISTVCKDTSTLSTTITMTPGPPIGISKSNDITCSMPFAQLVATGANQYTWSPSLGLSGTNINNPTASPGITTTYYVTGTDLNGCPTLDSVTVQVSNTGEGVFYMPSAFTPNGDGMNDCFGLQYFGAVEQLEFRIFDRWGRNVFYTNNPGICWDGKYMGKTNDGNYVYYIKAVTNCGPVFKKGNVLLIR